VADSGFRFLDPPTPEEEVTRVLKVLADGTYTPETLEGTAIDLKEDASSRNQKTGTAKETGVSKCLVRRCYRAGSPMPRPTPLSWNRRPV